jgi:hypothetical protein
MKDWHCTLPDKAAVNERRNYKLRAEVVLGGPLEAFAAELVMTPQDTQGIVNASATREANGARQQWGITSPTRDKTLHHGAEPRTPSMDESVRMPQYRNVRVAVNERLQ